MFERFCTNFSLSPPGQVAGPPWHDGPLLRAGGYAELARRFAGCTFEDGLYRLHDAATGPRGAALIADAFPAFAPRASPFGFDWLGRQFALDAERSDGGEALVLLLEPGTGEVLEVPLPFSQFHEQLSDLREPALAASFFDEWRRADPGAAPLSPAQCAGYRVPLFLGGEDAVGNLEVVDMEVYWSLCGQLLRGTTHLPPGTRISEVAARPPPSLPGGGA